MSTVDNDAISWRIISKYLGILLLPMAVALLIPLGIALVEEDWVSLVGFAFSLSISLGLGWYLQRGIPESQLNKGEGFAIIALSFPLASALGAIPFCWSQPISWLDGFFDAMSGFSTTGLSVLDPEKLPACLLFWRAEMQWLGGMGFIVLFLGFIMNSGSRLALLVPSDESEVREKLSLSQLARRTLWIYLIMTVVQTALMYTCGASFFDALCYTFATVSTGGFASHNDSIAAFSSPWIHGIVSIFMILGATQFSLYIQLIWFSDGWKERLYSVWSNVQLRLFALLLLLGLAAALLAGTAPASFYSFAFTALSAQSTAGFDLHSYIAKNTIVTILLLPPMFIGGSLVSTAGGIKLIRLLVAFSLLRKVLATPYRTPHEVEKTSSQITLSDEKQTKNALLLIILQLFIIFFSALCFIAAGYDALGSFFEVTSALGTVGLSVGIVKVGMPAGLKSLIIVLMWMGRVEVLPVFMLVHALRNGWRKS